MDNLEVYLKMRVELPFIKRKGLSHVHRFLIVEKDEDVKKEGISNWPVEFGVNFFIEWAEGDRRDAAILAGKERRQNVRVDVRGVLLTLQRMFPELNITFTTNEDYELLLERERAEEK